MREKELIPKDLRTEHGKKSSAPSHAGAAIRRQVPIIAKRTRQVAGTAGLASSMTAAVAGDQQLWHREMSDCIHHVGGAPSLAEPSASEEGQAWQMTLSSILNAHSA